MSSSLFGNISNVSNSLSQGNNMTALKIVNSKEYEKIIRKLSE